MTGSKRYVLLIFSLHVFLPLLLGGCIYLFFRPHSVLGSWLDELLDLNAVFIRPALLRTSLFLLPDFFWSYSLSFLLLLIRKPPAGQLLKTASFIFLLLVGAEVVQFWMPHLFTFDFLDLFAAAAAFFLSLFFYQRCLS